MNLIDTDDNTNEHELPFALDDAGAGSGPQHRWWCTKPPASSWGGGNVVDGVSSSSRLSSASSNEPPPALLPLSSSASSSASMRSSGGQTTTATESQASSSATSHHGPPQHAPQRPTTRGQPIQDPGASLQHHNMDSRYLDAAASLLFSTNFSLMGASSAASFSAAAAEATVAAPRASGIVESTRRQPQREAPMTERSGSFSRLLDRADDRRHACPEEEEETDRGRRRRSLPALAEEASVASADSILASSFLQPSLPPSSSSTSTSFSHAAEIRTTPRTDAARDAQRRQPPFRAMRDSLLAASQATIVDEVAAGGGGATSPAAGLPPSSVAHRTEERRLASLAGAAAQRTGDRAFRVSVELPSTTVREVMDVVGNPDLLGLWCDPVRALVITRSSEGARNAANMRGPSETGREYEGEWIEATTTNLAHPRAAGCVYNAARSMADVLGFPSYGKVRMFVERQRGHVGLTIGPFAGGIEVYHKIRIASVVDDNGECSRIRIADEVRLLRRDEDGTFCGGVLGLLERCVLPTTDNYMDQVLSSMARLRFLIENGEASCHPSRLQLAEATTVMLHPNEDDGGGVGAPLLRGE